MFSSAVILLWIKKRVFQIISVLGVTGCCVLGTIAFYEGIPVLGWWPFNKIPVVGYLADGEIDRRIAEVERKRELAILARKQETEEKLGELEAIEAAREAEIRRKNLESISELARAAEEARNELSGVEEDKVRLELEKAIQEGRANEALQQVDRLVNQGPDIVEVPVTVPGICEPETKVVYRPRNCASDPVPDRVIDALRNIK